MTSSGGDAVQITKGSGPDLGIKISADNKKLLYYQSQTISDFWIGSLGTGSVKRLTFDDLPKFAPKYSPDGSSIAFFLSEPDPLRPKESIQISNRDGSNRRVLVSGKERLNNFQWSPDGRWIAYSEGAVNNNIDLRKTYLVEVSRPGSPRFLSDGGPNYWLDASTVIVRSKAKNLMISIETGTVKEFFLDSTSAVPVLKGKYMFYRDNHFRINGRFIVEVDGNYAPKGKPRKIMEPFPFYFTGFTDYFYFMPEPGRLVKLSLPSGKVQNVPGTFPGLNGDFSVSDDGKDVIYTEAHEKGKLVMIDNAFK